MIFHDSIKTWQVQVYLILLVIIPPSVPAYDVAGDDVVADVFVWGSFRLFWNEAYKFDNWIGLRPVSEIKIVL